MRSIRIGEDRPGALLSIGDLSARTGVPPATLRTWEDRYGLPRPRRLPGGHRRYAPVEVTLVEEVLRQRASGLSLPAAIRQVRTLAVPAEPSLFAALRGHHPDLMPVRLRKATLLALARAVEDECCARAAAPVLFASFQRRRFYRQSQARWEDLARTARKVVVFADFVAVPVSDGSPLCIPVPGDSPLRREWVLVCDAPDHPACLAGWEHPGQEQVADADRLFETVWTVDPQVVREAARTCLQLAATFAPEREILPPDALTGTPPAATADLRRATGLLTRVMGYVDGARP